jgi:hypothetical protein
MLTRPTVIINNAPITLSPTFGTTGSGTALNPFYTACDPTNGNYFLTTGRDLVSFCCAPAASAPTWSSLVVYQTGQVVNFTTGSPAVTTAYIALANTSPNLAQTPATSPTFWAVYTDGSSTVTLFSSPDTCTGRTSDVDDYVVPLPTPVSSPAAGEYPGVEFLVLPSSVFTQANQQFQFQASSNLVSVYVRNF